MTGGHVHLRFDDCLKPEQVDEVWDSASPDERSMLLTWQYALLRSAVTDGHRPTKAEANGLMHDIVSATPGMITLRSVVLAFGLSVFVWIAVDSLAHGDKGLAAAFGLIALGLLSFAVWRNAWVSGPRGKAMRCVWDARKLPADQRREQMLNAVPLEARALRTSD